MGNFDGVHPGHQGVIAEVIERARFLGGHSLAITFDPHPARVLHPEQPHRPITPLPRRLPNHPAPPGVHPTLVLPFDPPPARVLHPEQPHRLITPLARRLELLAATGIDATLVLPFTDALRHMHPRDFVKDILVNTLHVTEVHEGKNFRFGYHAEAGIEGLEALGRELGFGVTIYAPRIVRGSAVSSSRTRKLIAAGDVSRARTLLGRPFSVDSTPAPGRGYGSRHTVPTVNLAPYPELLPANGVYVTTLAIGGYPEAGSPMLQHGVSSGLSGRGDMKGLQPLGQTFDAVTNVGNRPTFGADR